MRFSSSLLAVATAFIPHAHAWGAVGHEIVATIAQMHLHPTVMPKLCEMLHYPGECHLAPVASWADRVRALPKYRWTGPLHYIGAVDDYPSATCAFPGQQGWEGRTHINVLSAIRNTTTVLQEFEELRKGGLPMEEEPGYVQDALKFLIHFVGDMHQPLHLTGRDRGGNGDKVAFDGRTTNLHSVWDTLLISERLRTLPYNYTRPLPLPDIEAYLRGTIYDPYIRRLVWEGLLGKWEDEVDEWLVCPSSASNPVSSASASAQSPLVPLQLASIWHSISSFFTSAGKHTSEGEAQDGLGVDDDTLCPYAWAKPLHQLNCDVVFPPALDEQLSLQSHSRWFMIPSASATHDHDHDHDHEVASEEDVDAEEDVSSMVRRKSKYFELNTPAYAGRIKREWIVEKLLSQAGIRLAGVLNWIFADLGEEGRISRRHLACIACVASGGDTN